MLTAAQMREVDRAMIEDLHIELIQMMENAGRNLADLVVERFAPASALVLSGSGGNGGGGLAAARHLANRGLDVRVVSGVPEPNLTPVPAHQMDVVRRMGIAVEAEPAEADVIVDALIGYSLRGDPRGRIAGLIEWANRVGAPVCSLDTPSGLDATSGHVGSPCIRAAATLTLALPKSGLLEAPEIVGDLFVADISVPPSVYENAGVSVGRLFADGPIVELIT